MEEEGGTGTRGRNMIKECYLHVWAIKMKPIVQLVYAKTKKRKVKLIGIHYCLHTVT